MLRLAFHCQRADQQVKDAINYVQPRVIKSMAHDAPFWRAVKDAYNPYLIGRFWMPPGFWIGKPEEAADDYVGYILGDQVVANGLYDAIEGPNEDAGYPTPPELLDQYDRFQERFALRLRDAGIEPVLFNFGTGNFLGADYLAHFRRSLAVCRIIGFHGYGWPSMQDAADWQVLRYRQVMPAIRAVYGPQHVPMLTEVGITNAVSGGPDKGYRYLPQSPEDYWQQNLSWLNDRLTEDEMFGCVFQTGGQPDWETFEVLGTSIIDRMAELSAGTPEFRVPEWPSAPVVTDQYQFILGFRDYVGAREWTPLRDQAHDWTGDAWQPFVDSYGREGVIYWSKADNRIRHAFWED